MPQKLEGFNFSRKGPKKDYKYKEFLDGSTWKMSVEESQHHSMNSFRSALYSEAKSLGDELGVDLKLRTHLLDEEKGILVFQTYVEGEKATDASSEEE